MSSQRSVSVSRVIDVPADVLFAIIDNPAKHPLFDGSGTVKASRVADTHLKLGDRFGMDMKKGAPYRISNKVVEYEADRLLAWAHFGGHRWRYELEATEGGTRVTETFDWSTARFPLPKLYELIGIPKRHVPAMERTLERLAELATAS